MNMWNKQGKSLSIIICSKWKGRFVVREYTPPPIHTLMCHHWRRWQRRQALVYVHKLRFSDCVYMCQESGSEDREGSFMDKPGEKLQKVIEREVFMT